MSEAAAKRELTLGSPVSELSGVGKRRQSLLRRLEIVSVSDLIRHLPIRHEYQYAEGAIDDLPMEAVGSARGTVVATRWFGGGGGGFGSKGRFQATLQDHSTTLTLVWFNARYLQDKIHPGMMLRVTGKVGAFRGYPQMTGPKWEEVKDHSETPAADDRLRPVYPATENLTSETIESLIADALPKVLPQLKDLLPADFLTEHAMPDLADAFKWIHQPDDEEQYLAARRRLAFNELLLLQLGIAIKRHFNETQLQAPMLNWNEAMDEHIRQRFPFKLTDSQQQVIREIASDLQKSQPMNRLLQGDVGSGKTVVALYALLMAVADRKQGTLMAPTELLAEQHYLSISDMLAGSNVRIDLLTASAAGPGSVKRRELLQRIEAGEVDIVIGTQALLSEGLIFNDLAVVVIDEQHRFGVLQRAAMRDRMGNDDDQIARSPHYLVMTATPIPRTLSLTVFGDLDVSTIRGLPPGRSPIKTRVVGENKADEVYRYLASRLDTGEQAYVVVPTIDETGNERTSQLKNVTAHAKLLQDKYCSNHKVASIHGRLKQQTRESIMQKFRNGEINVLVATTVIEVGVDVPNATMMIVEHAERFGLAQLHQLRGRIGRGVDSKLNLCVFITEPTTDDGQKRMKAIASTTDGFAIAEHDLEIRGMGDFFGTRQSGMPPLRVARIPQDMDLLQLAKRDAAKMIEQDPTLSTDQHKRLRKVLIKQYGEMLGVIDVG